MKMLNPNPFNFTDMNDSVFYISLVMYVIFF
jgi:hypothetical protein